MINNTNIEESIELFVKGKLSEPALSDFKNLMQTDVSVAEEVELQKITVKAIQENRMLGLKARLNNINVGTGVSSSNVPSTFAKYFSIKSAAVIVATVSVGIGAYYFTQNQLDGVTTANLISQENIIADSALPPHATNEILSTNEAISNEETVTNVNMTPEEPSGTKVDTEIIVNNTIADTQTSKPVKQKKNGIKGEDMLDQKFEDGSEADISAVVPTSPASVEATVEATKTSDVDIKNIQDGKHNFHYMLKESILFLYGNFDATPYEILEFNEKGGQSIYLYYDKSFFELKTGQTEPSKLKRISDKKLLDELTASRNKKH